MNYTIDTNLTDNVFNTILNYLSKSGQLTTTQYVKKNEPYWVLAKDNNDIIGFICGKKSEDYDYEIGYFFVKEEYRKKGIGGTLFDIMYDLLKNTNIEVRTFSESVRNMILKKQTFIKHKEWNSETQVDKKIESWVKK